MDGQKVVKVFCHEQKAMEDFHKVNEALRNSAEKANGYANLLMPGKREYRLDQLRPGGHDRSGSWHQRMAGVTVGTVVTFVGLNKNFTNPYHPGEPADQLCHQCSGRCRACL